MSQRYITHLSTVCLLHAIILFGGFQLFKSEFISKKDSVQFQIAAAAIKMSFPAALYEAPKAAAPVQKNIVKTAPKRIVTSPVATTPVPAVDASPGVGTDHNGNANGSINGIGAGQAGTVPADLRTLYTAELRAKIDLNKFYPSLSRRLGQQGEVVVAFTLEKDGSLTDIRIASPSRFKPLNESALEAVKKVRKFKSIPEEFGSNRMELKIPIRFVTI